MAWKVVTDQEGRRIRAELLSENDDGVRLRLEEGGSLLLPHDLLVRERGGDLLLLATWRDLKARTDDGKLFAAPALGERDEGSARLLAEETEVIPLAAEILRVGKRKVERGRVHVRTHVVETRETVDEPLVREEVEVERVNVGRLVETAEPARHDGDVTVIPLYEEVLVVEKRLMLTEELRVRRKRTERREPQEVTLRREEAVVERLDARGQRLQEENREEDM